MTLLSGLWTISPVICNMEVILTFATSNHAIKAENILMKNNLTVRVMPLPPAIRAGCGLCLRIVLPELNGARVLLAREDVPIEGIYRKDSGNYLPC